MKSLLFLCTGNYYRSRFAEEVFNHCAQLKNLNWSSNSAGLQVAETRHENPGTCSQYALEGLSKLCINPKQHHREPRDVTEADFRSSDITIALSLTEHKPMVIRKFPHLLSVTQFWEFEDIQFEIPEIALAHLHKQTIKLVDQLADAC